MICGTMAFTSCCKKHKSSASPTLTYAMSATIVRQGDTTLFAASGPPFVTTIDKYQIHECDIFGADTSGNTTVSKFTFTIENYYGVGSYLFDSSSTSYGDYEKINPAYAQTDFAQCTIIITSITGADITGTFSGTLTDGSVVTNGTFTAYGGGH